MGRQRVQDDIASLARAAKQQLRLADSLSASLDQRMKHGAREAAKRGEVWQPDDGWRADFDKSNACIVQVGGALTKALEAEQKKLGTLSTEQLETQFRHELMRAAAAFSAEDWALLDRVRMRAVLKGA